MLQGVTSTIHPHRHQGVVGRSSQPQADRLTTNWYRLCLLKRGQSWPLSVVSWLVDADKHRGKKSGHPGKAEKGENVPSKYAIMAGGCLPSSGAVRLDGCVTGTGSATSSVFPAVATWEDGGTGVVTCSRECALHRATGDGGDGCGAVIAIY